MPAGPLLRARPFARHLAVAGALVFAIRVGAQQADTTHATEKSAPDSLKWGTLPLRWDFGVGGYLPNISTAATLTGPLGLGQSINLEHKLGLAANTQTIDLLAGFRFKKRNMVSLEFFNFSRSASRTITDSLVVNDTVYHAGATIDLRNQIQYYGFTYRYYIWRRQRWELGAGLGIDGVNLGFNFGVRASAGNKADSAQTHGTITAPVPMLGLYFDWEMWQRLYLKASLQALFLTYQQYSGGIRDRKVSVDWYPWLNYGFGVGWHYVGLDIKRTGQLGGSIEANYGIQGVSIYLAAAFGRPEPVPYRAPKPITEPPAGQDFGLVPRLLTFSIGAFGPNVNSSGKFSTQNQSGTGINFEDVLGLPARVTSLDIEAALRIANRSLLTFSYFSFTRSGSKVAEDTIHWGDSTYAPGVQLDGSGGLTYFGFSYRYYFWRTSVFQMGGGIGVDEVELRSSLGIKSLVAGHPDSLQLSGTLSTPAPMLGLYVDWEMLHRFYLRGSGEWISATIGKIGATVTDDMVAAEWYALDNYGIGFGYHYVGANVTRSLPRDARINFDYTVHGPTVYLTAAF